MFSVNSTCNPEDSYWIRQLFMGRLTEGKRIKDGEGITFKSMKRQERWKTKALLHLAGAGRQRLREEDRALRRAPHGHLAVTSGPLLRGCCSGDVPEPWSHVSNPCDLEKKERREASLRWRLHSDQSQNANTEQAWGKDHCLFLLSMPQIDLKQFSKCPQLLGDSFSSTLPPLMSEELCCCSHLQARRRPCTSWVSAGAGDRSHRVPGISNATWQGEHQSCHFSSAYLTPRQGHVLTGVLSSSSLLPYTSAGRDWELLILQMRLRSQG